MQLDMIELGRMGASMVHNGIEYGMMVAYAEGEGRWTIQAAIDEGVPVPVLSAALFARFTSRGNADFANRVLSAMRYAFGGHVEDPLP